jgi:glycine cleavage system aminomethyltransferase T
VSKNMAELKRFSPVQFTAEPVSKRMHQGWEVVDEYQNEGLGPALIDLSHIAKWDVQGEELGGMEKGVGIKLPDQPGQVLIASGLLTGRLTATRALVWSLNEHKDFHSNHPSFTEITDSYALMAILGREALLIMEKISDLDFRRRNKKPPFLLQGPVLHIPMTVLVSSGQADRGQDIVLLAFYRGYGQGVAETILDAGAQYDLRVSGFHKFLKRTQDGLWKKVSSGHSSPELMPSDRPGVDIW